MGRMANERRKMGGGYSGGYSNWIFIFGKLDIQNSCPSIPYRGGGTSQKKGDKYRKLTLFVQVSRGCFIAESPCLWGFLVFGVRKKGGGRYPTGYMEGAWRGRFDGSRWHRDIPNHEKAGVRLQSFAVAVFKYL